MGYGIDFTADIFLSRQDYGENIYSVQDEIDDLKKQSQQIREKLLMMIMGGVKSVNTKDCEDNECDAVDVLHIKFNDLMEWYDECNTKMLDLYYYKEYLENKQKSNGNT